MQCGRPLSVQAQLVGCCAVGRWLHPGMHLVGQLHTGSGPRRQHCQLPSLLQLDCCPPPGCLLPAAAAGPHSDSGAPALLQRLPAAPQPTRLHPPAGAALAAAEHPRGEVWCGATATRAASSSAVPCIVHADDCFVDSGVSRHTLATEPRGPLCASTLCRWSLFLDPSDCMRLPSMWSDCVREVAWQVVGQFPGGWMGGACGQSEPLPALAFCLPPVLAAVREASRHCRAAHRCMHAALRTSIAATRAPIVSTDVRPCSPHPAILPRLQCFGSRRGTWALLTPARPVPGPCPSRHASLCCRARWRAPAIRLCLMCCYLRIACGAT